MTKLLPKELAYASELMDQAKLGEALEIIENFEDTTSLSPEDQLSALLLKSMIYGFSLNHEKRVECSERAYQLSQDLGLVPESIEALIGKASIAFIGNLDKATNYITDAERRLSSLANDSSSSLLRRNLLMIKSWTLLLRFNLDGAAESALECLKLSREQENKLYLGSACELLGYINLSQGNRTKALDYAMKALEYFKDLNHAVFIATSYNLIARIYRFEGDYDQALQYCKKSLSIREISKRTKMNVSMTLAEIYYTKSEINRAIKYRQLAIKLAEELNIIHQLASNFFSIGYLYFIINKKEYAIEYLERSMNLSEKWGLHLHMARSLCWLSILYINEKSREIANRYFTRLSDLFNQTKDKGYFDISLWYLISKATIMKSSTRIRDRMEAQSLYKKLIELANGDILIYSIGSLCNLLLEELSINNDPEILDEIIPLITKSLDMAEKAKNYRWLANSKLLQGKLALIQMNIEEAKQYLTQAQRIADLHGLKILAQEVSKEHDKLVIQINDWDNLKERNAPISERIKLASTYDVLTRIQGQSAVVPSELVDEQSTVLLILAEGGVLVFSYPFSEEWGIDEDLFSGFLSAFTSFSTEFFSKGLDRVKFGDEMMLMESIDAFSFCYLFKGQSYSAKQKLTKFAEEVQNDTSLWQSLEQHYKTSQILELKECPRLESLITEIFMSQS
jgi:tetratricopeptide (TPR) repeat protein